VTHIEAFMYACKTGPVLCYVVNAFGSMGSVYNDWTTGWRSGAQISVKPGDIYVLQTFQTGFGALLTSFGGYRSSFTGVMLSGREVNHSYMYSV
jgi:hypothetical protein